MTEDAGVKVAAYGSYYRLGVRDQAPFESVLETAVALSAPTVRIWAGTKSSVDATEEDWSRVAVDAKRVAGLAAQVQLTVSFEFHDLTLNDNAAGTVRLMESIRMDNVHTLWQPPADATQEECTAGLRAVLPWLGNVHVFCWRPGYTRLPLSEGEPDWTHYIHAIQTTGRNHFLMLEFVRDNLPDAFFEDAQTLKAWLLSKQEAKRD
jgi:sugar phosphate isomerase/epimerase